MTPQKSLQVSNPILIRSPTFSRLPCSTGDQIIAPPKRKRGRPKSNSGRCAACSKNGRPYCAACPNFAQQSAVEARTVAAAEGSAAASSAAAGSIAAGCAAVSSSAGAAAASVLAAEPLDLFDDNPSPVISPDSIRSFISPSCLTLTLTVLILSSFRLAGWIICCCDYRSRGRRR